MTVSTTVPPPKPINFSAAAAPPELKKAKPVATNVQAKKMPNHLNVVLKVSFRAFMKFSFSLNAPAQVPEYVGVTFAKAKGMSACFGHSGAVC